MKKQEKCIGCGNVFWSKARKNKITKEIVTLDNICQRCKNRIKQREDRKHSMERGGTIRIIPKEFEKEIRMRELYLAERERLMREKEEKKNIVARLGV